MLPESQLRMLIDYLKQLIFFEELVFLFNMKVEQSEYEKVIDLDFGETPQVVILPMLDLVMNIWNFKIIDYEAGMDVNFLKMLGKMGVRVFEKVRFDRHTCIYLVCYLVNT